MSRISVVVPIYNVEPYIAECLQSIARQTVRDLEVVMIDDGSTDGGGDIAARFAAHDPRFRLVRQGNRGLGAARNRGAALATRGEYLAFVDSDDILPPDAYERLLSTLEATGSDFATGAVRRLEPAGVVPARFLAETHARTRLRTHVTQFEPLIADRTAWNKLWRRAFWDAERLRFPEGVWHEDIPVTVPAHYRAAAVDVVADTVYLWRTRAGAEESITQRRLELQVLSDRFSAVEQVHDFLVAHAPQCAAGRYRRRLVRDDLRLYIDLLDRADAAYRREFLDRSRALLGDAPEELCDGLPAIDRLKWHLAGRGLEDELVEVVRFHRERWPATPVRRRGRWYGAYPFRGDRRLRIPDHLYQLGRADADLALELRLEDFQTDAAGRLRLHGHGSIAGFGAAGPGSQALKVVALPPGRWQGLRARAGGVRFPVRPVRRADLPARDAWSGFTVTLDAAALADAGTAELCAVVRARGVRRRRTRFTLEAAALLRTRVVATPRGLVEVVTGPDGGVRVRPRGSHAILRAYRLMDANVLTLSGDLAVPTGAFPELEVRRSSDGHAVMLPLTIDDARTTFRTQLPMAELERAAASAQRVAAGPQTTETWTLELVSEGRRLALEFPEELPGRTYATASLELALEAGPAGQAVIVDRQLTGVPVSTPDTPGTRTRSRTRPAR